MNIDTLIPLTPAEIREVKMGAAPKAIRSVGVYPYEHDLMLALAQKNGLMLAASQTLTGDGSGEALPPLPDSAYPAGAKPIATEREPGFIKPDTGLQVFFYEQDFYVLSNFSAFRIHVACGDGMRRWFNTSEEAYHWLKFDHLAGRGVQQLLDEAKSAHDAFKLAGEHKALRRPDWDDIKVEVMKRILRDKVDQHEYVRRKLLATGARELIEDSWRDAFWGWGPNRDGLNMLGKLWMQIRDELRTGNPS